MHDPGTDSVSPLAREIIKAGRYTDLVAPPEAPKLALELLSKVTPDELLTVPVRSYPYAFAMLAGLWLLHDGLEQSHVIAQQSPEQLQSSGRSTREKGLKAALNVRGGESVEINSGPEPMDRRDATETLSFWHAIMHRREGDFSNSKYWYARTGAHPIYPAMAAHAAATINPHPADKPLLRVLRDGWDPNAFVDLVQLVHGREQDPRLRVVQELQRIEWQLLFDHCAREASA